jgi:hypothetical protein
MSGGYSKQYTSFLAVCSPLDTSFSNISLVTSVANPWISNPLECLAFGDDSGIVTLTWWEGPTGQEEIKVPKRLF